MPVGAFGGCEDLMDLVAPAGNVYQAGTLSGNPLAMAAGLATLRTMLDTQAWDVLERAGSVLADTLRQAIAHAGAPCAVTQVGSLVTLFHLGDGLTAAPRNFDEAKRLDTGAFGSTHAAALAAGHLLPPSQFEALFASTAHTPEDFASLAQVVAETLGGEQ
jgi:glutamate-1-semialdehyde 2,1-aminomutase